eukprot:EG_transcript_51369
MKQGNGHSTKLRQKASQFAHPTVCPAGGSVFHPPSLSSQFCSTPHKPTLPRMKTPRTLFLFRSMNSCWNLLNHSSPAHPRPQTQSPRQGIITPPIPSPSTLAVRWALAGAPYIFIKLFQ